MNRFRVAWHVLRGRPVAWRVIFRGEGGCPAAGFTSENQYLLVADNEFRGDDTPGAAGIRWFGSIDDLNIGRGNVHKGKPYTQEDMRKENP